MKTLIALSLFISGAAWAQGPADSHYEISKDRWVCSANGYNVEGRVGRTIRGFVSDDIVEAKESALGLCQHFGYVECRISYCHWNPYNH